MDGNAHPVSPDDLYARLGTASAPLLIDVRRAQAFETDDRLIVGSARRLPDKVSEWRGALPVTYHVGPGPAQARVKLAFEWQSRPLHNVIVRIEGSMFPDEWVIFGNHHDAWVNGADDPISGAVALMETGRGLAELLKSGWRPKRTIILALWDGEEWGLLGSTEWAEKHAAELKDKAAVYINSDSTGKGWLSAGGSHGLQQLMNEVARDVMDPRTLRERYERLSHRALSTFEHLPADEIESGFARFADDAERDPDRAMPVYSATMLVLTRPS